jgi:aerobic C4-dicarboxylate transport protein
MRHLKLIYVQVLIGIVLGVTLGALHPELGAKLKPLGDIFIGLVKVVIAPVVFCTVASGIAQMSNLKTLGRVGGKALIYFEVVSTLALFVGIAAAFLIHPGAGFNIDPATLDPKVAADYAGKAQDLTLIDYVMHLVPTSYFGPLASGDILQTLVVAILTGIACTRIGAPGEKIAQVLETTSKLFFGIIHLVVKLAPLAAFGAMAFTIGRYGVGALVQLGALVATFYITSLIFVIVVLGGVARLAGFSIFRFIAYIREELLIVLGTSSSETVLPQMMEKMQRLGAAKPVVGLVIPAGYSFNLDGTNIYMTLATLFLAQATNTELSAMQITTLLLVAMLTSKGATGVTGAGFIVLAATLAVVPDIPVTALAILVGIDRFMSECRALVNLTGNGVATLVVAAWEKALDRDMLNRELMRGPAYVETLEAENKPILDAALPKPRRKPAKG